MAGIYIHIPFCKSRCAYCDFFSTTGSEHQAEAFVQALHREMAARRGELGAQTVQTLYVGGGTPSSLPIALLVELMERVTSFFPLEAEAEVTVEANPDDVTEEWLEGLRTTPVNRLSMGVQTFDDTLLRLLRRRHSGLQAQEAVERCRRAGFGNLSLDLIYGLPGQTLEMWESDVRRVLSLGVQHLSAYALSYETGTALTRMRDDGLLRETDEEYSLAMYNRLLELTGEAGWQHYEISNFCRPGFRSRHNSSYWQGAPYLGFGPGAHSYDGRRLRRWNKTNLQAYIRETLAPFDCETLTDDEFYDEFVMTRLRTADGLDLGQLSPARRDYCLRMARPHLSSGKLVLHDQKLSLTKAGIFVSNDIISDLMN